MGGIGEGEGGGRSGEGGKCCAGYVVGDDGKLGMQVVLVDSIDLNTKWQRGLFL